MPGLTHGLPFAYDGLTDDEVIEDLSSRPSLRRHADQNLGHDRIRDAGSDSKGYHGAFLYYLRTYRPGILTRLDDEAAMLAEDWPKNYEKLRFLAIKAWWYNALKERVRRLVRLSMRVSGSGTPKDPWINEPARAWVDRVWPVFLEIHRATKEGVPPTMADLRRVLDQVIHLPTAIYLREFQDPKLAKEGRKSTFVGRVPLVKQIGALLAKLVREERDRIRKATAPKVQKRRRPRPKAPAEPSPKAAPEKAAPTLKKAPQAPKKASSRAAAPTTKPKAAPKAKKPSTR